MISLAYLHTLLSLRLPSLSPSHLSHQDVSAGEVKREMGSSVTFLIEPTSIIRYGSAREAWGGIWEAIGKEVVRPSHTQRSSLTDAAECSALYWHPRPASRSDCESLASTYPRNGRSQNHAGAFRSVPLICCPESGTSLEEAFVLHCCAETVEAGGLAET